MQIEKVWIDGSKKRLNPLAFIAVNFESRTWRSGSQDMKLEEGEHAFNGNIQSFPEAMAIVGLMEIDVCTRPDDFRDKTHIRDERDEEPYIVYSRRDQKVIDEATNAEIWLQIDAIERQAIMPRQLRDMLLSQADADKQPWYAKVKEIDDAVGALKAKLVK